jgi:L-threonylcarbamoyladenylate synthase
LAKSAIAADDSVGFRVPKDNFCQKLCASFRKPIVSTSANISGANPPACFAQIAKNIIKSVDYVVQFRQNERTPYLPSSIIKLGKNSEFQIIRK